MEVFTFSQLRTLNANHGFFKGEVCPPSKIYLFEIIGLNQTTVELVYFYLRAAHALGVRLFIYGVLYAKRIRFVSALVSHEGKNTPKRWPGKTVFSNYKFNTGFANFYIAGKKVFDNDV